MKMLDMIYENVIDIPNSKDSKEFADLTKKINEFLNIITLDHKKVMELDDLIASSQAAAEKQGFENGFKYAMALKKECGLL